MTRLVQITDTHIYDTPEGRFDGVDTRASLASVLEHLRDIALAYDAIALTGDLAMDASAGAYAWLEEALRGERAPRLVLPGNHDDPALLAAAGFVTRAAPACIPYGAWRVFLLDTHVPGQAHGALGADQLEWFARSLDEPHAGADAVFLHHHPLPLGSPWMDAMGLQNADRFWSVVDAHGRVKLVTCGHVHQNFDTYRGSVRVLATPSTCVQFLPRSDRYGVDTLAPGYRVVDLRDDGTVRSQVVRVSATQAAQSTARRR